jgi:hypothetical protein
MPRSKSGFLGTGEAAQGPTAAAIANAVADATGARLRELPLTPDNDAETGYHALGLPRPGGRMAVPSEPQP